MTASAKNWIINWLRSAPAALRTPVSMARWAARAVISVTKLNDAEEMIKTAMTVRAARSVLSPLGDIEYALRGDKCKSPIGVRCSPTVNPGGYTVEVSEL